MTPYTKFQVIFQKWLGYSASLLGINILDKDFKIRFHTICTVVTISSVLFFCVYTIAAFEADIAWKGSTCLSLALQGIVKSFCILMDREKIVFLTTFLERIYAVNEKKPSLKTKETMNEYSVQVYNFTGALFGLYALCAVGFFLYPVMAFAIFHMSEPCLPIFIPGVDINTKKGYTVTSIYHYLVLLVATLGLAFIDALFLNLVFNMLTMSELQCNQLSKLNEEMDNAKEHATSIRFRLINFFKMHQEMERYIDVINDYFFLMIFVQIMTTSLCTVLIVYIIMTISWYPAYLLTVCLIFQLFLYCALGTVVEIANDRLERAILQTNYHLLPFDLQKQFLFMVKVIQKAQFLKTGGTKLDVTMFVWIMRKIYTFIMMLRTVM